MNGKCLVQQTTFPGFDMSECEIHETAQDVSDFLLTGEQNAVSLGYLVKVSGLDERAVRVKIHKERLAGVPILSNCRTGYYLAGTNAEKDRCVKSMLHRAAEIAKAASAIEAAEVTDFEGKN